MRRLVALGGATLAGAAGLVGGAYLGARQISGPRRPAVDYGFTPFEVGLGDVVEDVALTAADGTRLAAWWLDRAEATQVVVVCHGHRGSKADMLGIGPGLWREGYAVLLLDFRGNGASSDGPQSLAHWEQQDLTAAIDWVVRRRPGCEVDVVGFSMGAAVTLMVAARDQRVRRVVADSSFADVHGVIEAAARGMRLPPVPLVGLVDRMTRWVYGYGFHEVVPVDVVGQVAPRPLLLWHGTADSVIPVEHAHRLAAAAGPGAELRLTEGADHCGSYFADRPGYIRAVAQWLRQ